MIHNIRKKLTLVMLQVSFLKKKTWIK